MGNCLVTKLKAAVNNPDLPVLERMQQFTLDAITASGNASMTDAQKIALNHFFYQIGAIHQDGVWSKINVLLIPMLATPVEGYTTYLVHDYKADTVAIPQSDKYTGVNGGLEATANITRTLNVPNVFVNSDSAAVILMEAAGHSVTRTYQSMIKYTYSDETTFSLGSGSSGATFYGNRAVSGYVATLRVSLSESNKIMAVVNIKGTPWAQDNGTLESFIYTEDGSVLPMGQLSLDTTSPFVDHTGTTVTKTEIVLSAGSVLGLVMSFSSALTDAERVKVCNAAVELRSAFEQTQAESQS